MSAVAQTRPENSRKIAMKNGQAVFFVYETEAGSPCVKYYVGRRKRPYHFRFPTSGDRDSHVANQISQLEAVEKEKQDRRAKRNQAHTLVKGDHLVSSWGYEQTNVDFYEVVNVPSKCYVMLRRVRSNIAESNGGAMSGEATPNHGNYSGEPFRAKVSMATGSPSVKIHTPSIAYEWDGKPKYVSWYG